MWRKNGQNLMAETRSKGRCKRMRFLFQSSWVAASAAIWNRGEAVEAVIRLSGAAALNLQCLKVIFIRLGTWRVMWVGDTYCDRHNSPNEIRIYFEIHCALLAQGTQLHFLFYPFRRTLWMLLMPSLLYLYSWPVQNSFYNILPVTVF